MSTSKFVADEASQGLAELGIQHIQMLSWLYHQQQTQQALPDVQCLSKAFPDVSDVVCLLSELERVNCLSTSNDEIQLSDHLIPLPVIGQVAAGTPIEAIENHQVQLVLPLDIFRQRPTYLLKVRGDSMKDAGIFDGDLIAVRKTGESNNGKIVVARVDNEVTVKRLKIEKDHIALLPENQNYEPILVAPADLVIEGEFVGLIRGGRTLH